MALLEKHLYVKRSKLPNAGKGLFTKVFIPKGTRIVEYKGRRTVWKDVKDDDGKNGYIFYINSKNVIDALPTPNALGRYANDARGYVRVKGITNNSEYVVEGKRCFIEATKDIPAGGEIFVGYGAEYWKTMRDNWKLELAEKKAKEKEKKKARKKVKKARKKTTKKKTSKKQSTKKTSAKKKVTKKKSTKKKAAAR
ncbi:MAG TPA: SET domain-containing protein [Cyclobacteriaceae bacterium]|nr:SET domain-containing protein [Cyclobacteriaceae bacterium]